MRKFSINVVAILSSIFIITSCERTCLYKDFGYFTEVSVPDTVSINQTIEIETSFYLKNDCGRFYEFFVDKRDDIIIVRANAEYYACDCVQGFVTKEEVFRYTPTSMGTKYFVFGGLINNHIYDTLVVQ
jgi:hypothetical protein